MNPTLIDIPREIVTPRLILRTPEIGDGPMVFGSVRASLAACQRFMPWATENYSADDSEIWCRKSAAKWLTREELSFLMLQRQDNTHVGNVSAHHVDWAVPKAEIGYWLRTDQTGQGYMTEAVRALTNLFLQTLGFQRLEIRCDERNLRSARVPELCGYMLDGVLTNDCRTPDGSLRNTRIHSCTPLIHGQAG